MEQNFEIKNKGQAQLFNSPFFEILTKTNPFIHIVAYGAIVGGLLIAAHNYVTIPFYTNMLIYAGGLLFWTLFEYLMHRYLFHIISENKAIKRFRYIVHGVHHEYPKDEERVFMPPVPGFMATCILFAVFYVFLGHYTYVFLAAVITGYMVYSLMHYGMHHIAAPRMLKKIWMHHSLHHYKYTDKAFGVSSVLWDRIFGTMPPKRKKSKY